MASEPFRVGWEIFMNSKGLLYLSKGTLGAYEKNIESIISKICKAV